MEIPLQQGQNKTNSCKKHGKLSQWYHNAERNKGCLTENPPHNNR